MPAQHTPKPQLAWSVLLPFTVCSLPVLIGATCDIPAWLEIGPISGLAAVTVLIAYVAWAMWLIRPTVTRHTISAVRPFLGLLFWITLSSLWGGISVRGLQNQLVWWGFVGMILLSGSVCYRTPSISHRLRMIVSLSSWLATCIFLYTMAGRVRGWNMPAQIGYRQFALFMILPFAWHLAAERRRNRNKFPVTLSIIALILVSLSRTALAVSVFLSVFAFVIIRARHLWIWLALAGILSIGILLVLFSNLSPLSARNEVAADNPDLSFQLGPLSVYGSGRVKMWRITLESFVESPWIGKGPGSAAEAVIAGTGWLEHPHNDYLRVLHDYGIVGFCLLLLGIIGILRVSWQSWLRAGKLRTQDRQIHLAALLAMVGMSLAMVTDNVVAYSFLMFPLGVTLGASLGVASRQLADGEHCASPHSEVSEIGPKVISQSRTSGSPSWYVRTSRAEARG